jgi:hypothetical protein
MGYGDESNIQISSTINTFEIDIQDQVLKSDADGIGDAIDKIQCD